MTSNREKFKFTNTLVCLLKAMEGVQTTVELRNENTVCGKILLVDARMHLTMENVVFKPVKGPEQNFSHFFIQGHHIRFVHIPDHINIIKLMEKQLHVRQSVHSNINKAKEERQRKRQILAQKREAQILKKEARLAKAYEEQSQTISTVISNRSDPS